MKRVLLALLFITFAASAMAQTPVKRPGLSLPFDPVGLNSKVPGLTPSSGDPLQNIIGALDAALLPDLKFAQALALKSGSKVTEPCYSAWITIIEARQSANLDPQGSPLPEPTPGLITKFEKLVEIRNALQPDSPFMISCSPVASMVRKDIVAFIGVVLSGGAGLATLVPGL